MKKNITTIFLFLGIVIAVGLVVSIVAFSVGDNDGILGLPGDETSNTDLTVPDDPGTVVPVQYTVTCNLSAVSGLKNNEPYQTVSQGQSFNLFFRAADGFSLPDTIEVVSGIADGKWSWSVSGDIGILSVAEANGDVFINITADALPVEDIYLLDQDIAVEFYAAAHTELWHFDFSIVDIADSSYDAMKLVNSSIYYCFGSDELLVYTTASGWVSEQYRYINISAGQELSTVALDFFRNYAEKQ